MRNFRNDERRHISHDNQAYDTYYILNIGGREYPELRYADDTIYCLIHLMGWRR